MVESLRDLFGLDVVAGEYALIANVEFSAADHRVCPAWPSLIGDLEAAFLFVTFRRSVRETHYIIFAQQVKFAVGISQRAFADASVSPHRLARRKLDAAQDRVVEPIQITVQQENSPMMVHHLFVAVNLFGFHNSTFCLQAKKRTASAVVG